MKTSIERHATELTPALIMQSMQPVLEEPYMWKKLPEQTDLLLHGQMVRIAEVGPDESYDGSVPYTVARFGRFFRYITDYGYEGFIADGDDRIQTEHYLPEFQTAQDIGTADAERMKNVWAQYADICEKYLEAYREAEAGGYGNIYNRHAKLATVWAGLADLFPVPDITDTASGRITLCRGAKIYVDEDQNGVKEGWTRVYPVRTLFFGEEAFFEEEDDEEADADNVWQTEGAWYIRTSALKAPFELVEIDYDEETRMEDCAVYGHVTPQDEAAFRHNVAETAKLYLGTQYRWAGKTAMGIDCSGLCSMAYMLNGVYIYRDARMEAGYPVHEIVSAEEWKQDRSAALSRMKEGDLIYYKGHITMYLGDGRYIHATGKAGSDGVVINSFNENDADYRADLAKEVLAVGSIF
ncbi:MAG: C40 family peptidase [Eubacteriales bacterium]|nr:C40 family peptidase [Eubacteriales bacterium]